ncbi:MAG: hypothetical protein IID37_15680, partial [Planctomycetes bacterium]|nr:hypothetical protein [Planctomycetota bacterium]
MAIAEDDYAKKHWSGCVLRWRRLASLGGLFLAVSFFLPAVDGCSSPIVPAQYVWEAFCEPSGSVTEWVWLFSVMIAAYLLG